MKRTLFLLLALLGITQMWAYTCKVGGICYDLNGNNHTATVTYSGYPYNNDYTGHYGSGSLKGLNINIPSTITYNNVEYTVTAIGDKAFYDCESSILMASVTLPSTVTSIGDQAFWKCTELTSFVIPNSVTSIGEYAFYGCSGLTSVISEIETPFSFGSLAFSNIASNCTLTVPAGTKAAYIAAGWTETVFKGGIVEMDSRSEQTLDYTLIPEMTEGDAAYSLPQKTTQGLTLTWSVADATIASISGNQLTPLKAGTTTVTATQAGNDSYQPFTKTFTLTVNVRPAQPAVEVTDISQLDNAIYIDKLEARAGETVTLSVKMKNSFTAEGFGFDLVLPEGVTVALDEYGDPIAELSTTRTNSSITNHFDVDFKLDGSLNIQAYSTKGRTISGNDGEVALITIKISESMTAGEYPIGIKNIAITDENSVTVTVEEVISSLEIPAYIIGDANNDGNVNIGDLTAISHYILERPDASFLFVAADANQDGNVNVGDLTAVSHIILWGSIVRPQTTQSRKAIILDPQ